jgi:hypothetical protein
MRHCLGQQPFKYFVETDPTVPQWVKKITQEDIDNWNEVLNKQNSFNAGRALTFDGNTLNFDYYVNSGGNNANRLLTENNIISLCRNILSSEIQSEFSEAINNVVTNEIQQYVTGRINELNLNQYVDEDEIQIIINQIKNYVALNYVGNSEWNRVNAAIAAKQNNIYLQPMTMKTFVNGEAEYILRKKNEDEYAYGLNFERLDEEENYPYKLSLALDVLSDGETNEIYKSKFNIEPGYNGTDFYNLIDFHYGDTEYDKNTIYLSVPVATKIIDKPEVEAAVTVGALCRYLDGNFERKIVTLDSSIGFVDIAYYKELWGITGDNWTPDDYKDLLKEWYNVSINWDDDNDQNIKNLYYDTHQRAININLTNEDEIYPAVEWVAIQNASEENFNSRTVSWWYSDTIDGVKNFLSRGTWDEDEQMFVGGDTYPGNDKYYWMHGDISAKTKIPSVDAVAKYAARGLSITQGSTSNTFDINLLNYAETILDTINANLNFDSTNRKVQIKSGNTLLSEVQLTDWVTKDTEQTISGKKTFNSDIYVNNNKGLKYSITAGGVTTERYMIAKDNVERIIVGNSSDALQFQSNNRPTYNNTQIALSNDFVNEETTFSGSVVGNKIYNLSTAISSLTVSSIENSKFESNIFFTTASTISSPFLTLPANTKIIGEEPDWEADKSYVMSVLKGVVVFGEIETYSA